VTGIANADRRRSALGRFLRELTELKTSGQTKLSPALSRGARSLELDAWETDVLRKALAGEAIANGHWSAVFPEGLAFQSKVVAALEENGEDDPNNLMTDAAVGLALQEEAQRAIHQMILAGDVGKAKRLTSFRNKLGATVSQLKERIGVDGFAGAEALSTELVEPFGEEQATEPKNLPAPPAPEADREAVPQVEVTPSLEVTVPPERYEPDWSELQSVDEEWVAEESASESTPTRSKPSGLILVALIALLCVLALPRLLKGTPPPIAELPELPALEAVVETSARPPSLFVKVDSPTWGAISVADRLDYLERVGATIEPSGYTGIHVQAGDGRTVAQWLEVSGARIFDASEPRARR